jgi:peptidoglycan/LPS O-acetylase OafA/YrhL
VHPRRYLTLDAWRGAAALAVFLYHRFLGRAPVGAFWLAVQLFFVISGYCIAAAADEAARREMSFVAFMKRRLHRIAPPYLASVVLAIVARLMWKGFGPIVREWSMYLANFAMLQWVWLARAAFGGAPAHTAFDNPQLLVGVYWSLNYEEQFYLVAALLVVLAVALRFRAALVALVVLLTAGVAVFNWSRPGMVTGLFSDYWLQFACGIVLYARLCRVSARMARVLDVALVAALGFCGWESWRRGELGFDPHGYHFHGQLTICVAFACLLVVLRPTDSWFMNTAVGRAFGRLGQMSYSLYLIHIPLLGLYDWFTRRIEKHLGLAAADVFIVAAVLGTSWLFHRLFERPFLNRPLPAAGAAPAPVASIDQGKLAPSAASAASSASSSERASA